MPPTYAGGRPPGSGEPTIAADAPQASGRPSKGHQPTTPPAEKRHHGAAQTTEQRRSPQPASGQPEEGNPGGPVPRRTLTRADLQAYIEQIRSQPLEPLMFYVPRGLPAPGRGSLTVGTCSSDLAWSAQRHLEPLHYHWTTNSLAEHVRSHRSALAQRPWYRR